MSRRTLVAVAAVVVLALWWLFRGGPAEENTVARPGSFSRRAESHGAGSVGTGEAGQPGSVGAEPKVGKLRPAGKEMPFHRRRDPGEAPKERFDPADVEKMIQTAKEDPDPDERASAISDLSLIDDTSKSLPVIRDAALYEKDPDVRLAIIVAIGRFGEQAPVDALAHFLQDPDPELRLEALDVVESLAEEEALSAQMRVFLERAAHDRDEDVRDKAQTVLDQLDGVSDVEDEPEGN